jgi:ribosome hibernation promoting factor
MIMFIDTRAIGFALTDAIQSHVECRLEQALGVVHKWVRRVMVRLEDVNAGRGGVDKRCQIVVVLSGGRGTRIVEELNADLYAAVDQAALRIRRSILRSLTRKVSRQRKDPQRPGALVAL